MAYALRIHLHESIDDLRRAVKTSDDEAQKTRIRAIIELREGATRREAAKRTVVDSDTITNWIKAYNRGGVAALKMSRGGRPGGNPKWDPTIFEALAREIDKGERYWSVPCMVAWIRERYGKAIPQKECREFRVRAITMRVEGDIVWHEGNHQLLPISCWISCWPGRTRRRHLRRTVCWMS